MFIIYIIFINILSKYINKNLFKTKLCNKYIYKNILTH